MDSKRIGKPRVYFYSIENLTDATSKDKLYVNSEAIDCDGIASSRASVVDNKVQHDTTKYFRSRQFATSAKLSVNCYNRQGPCSAHVVYHLLIVELQERLLFLNLNRRTTSSTMASNLRRSTSSPTQMMLLTLSSAMLRSVKIKIINVSVINCC